MKGATEFRVSLVLRRPDGAELGRGAGSGRGLYEAVRAAMTPLVAAGALPRRRRSTRLPPSGRARAASTARSPSSI